MATKKKKKKSTKKKAKKSSMKASKKTKKKSSTEGRKASRSMSSRKSSTNSKSATKGKKRATRKPGKTEQVYHLDDRKVKAPKAAKSQVQGWSKNETEDDYLNTDQENEKESYPSLQNREGGSSEEKISSTNGTSRGDKQPGQQTDDDGDRTYDR